MSKLNPNHPVTQAMDEQWQKLLAIYMHQQGAKEIVIGSADIETMPSDIFLSIQELHDGIHIRFVSQAEAIALARKHGGLPA